MLSKTKKMGAPFGNQFAVGNQGGRPLIHTDPVEVELLIQNYFLYIEGKYEIREKTETLIDQETGKVIIRKYDYEYCVRKPEPPTVTGLSLSLGFSGKKVLYDYAKREEFSYSIKKAITRIEKYHEIAVSKGYKCAGNIFMLKNFGWTDKSEMLVDNRHVILYKNVSKQFPDEH